MDLDVELEKLRDTYVSSSIRQRVRIMDQRLADPSALPNLLITRVAAIEAFARTLLMHKFARTKSDLPAAYKKYRYWKVHTMIKEYLKLTQLGTPEDVFGDSTWTTFKAAVNYRNLLVHECSFLGQVKYGFLEEACFDIYERLAKLSKVKRKYA